MISTAHAFKQTQYLQPIAKDIQIQVLLSKYMINISWQILSLIINHNEIKKV